MAADSGQVQFGSGVPRSVGAIDGTGSASVGVLAAMGFLAAMLGVRPLLRGIGVLTPKASGNGATRQVPTTPEVLDMPDVTEVLGSRARRPPNLNG